MKDDLLGAIADHLHYYGYQTRLEDGVLKAIRVPLNQPYIWILPVNGGAIFRTVFRVGPAAQQDTQGFCKFLNRANQLAVVSRFAASAEFLTIEGWFPPSYDREAFALFFNRYCADIAAPISEDRQGVLKFFTLVESTTPTS